MRLNEWLALFKKYREKKILSFRHLELFSSHNRHALRVALKRLTDKGVIQRISRGFYANPFNLPSLEEISAEIYRPSYVSLESALSRFGILSQIPLVLTCVTTRNTRTFNTSFGTIQYQRIQKKYFFGYQNQAGYSIADPEKAVLDFLYFHKQSESKSHISEWNLRSLDSRKLKSYAKQMKLRWPFATQSRITT